MRNNRRAGHSYERDIMNELKEFFPKVLTSRYASREMDDQKVDLVNTGDFNIQCKYTKRPPDAHTILEEMPKDKINLIFHKKPKVGGGEKKELVILKKEEFYKLLKILYAK